MWMEIFSGGKQKDSLGREHDGDALIGSAVAAFDAGRHEPPVVIGHPELDSPAWGWIKALRQDVRDGRKVLLAKAELAPEFADMLRRKLFKKRSAAFYPDGSLRHVGFLGATPPAVKGLADCAFREGAAPVFEFSEPGTAGTLARVLRGLREWLIAKDGQDAADRVVREWDIEELQTLDKAPETEAPAPAFAGENEETMTEEEVRQKIAAAEKAAADKARDEVRREFAEKEQKALAEARRKEARDFVEAMAAAGKITPAQRDGGLLALMESLAGQGAPAEFADGSPKDGLARMKEFLQSLPVSPLFSEAAGRAGEIPEGADKDAKTAVLARARAKTDGVSFAEGLVRTLKDHPELG
jgi:hypothetical protein